MTEDAEKFIFACGISVGQLMRCTDEDLDELLAWALERFPPEFGSVRMAIEEEKARRKQIDARQPSQRQRGLH